MGMFTFFQAPAFAVVPAGSDQAQACALLHAGGFSRGWTTDEFEALLTDRAVVADMLLDRRRDRGPPVGFALSRHAAGEAELCSIAVAPGLRGRGGGQVLLTTHMARLATRGVRRMVLEVDQGNAPARRLYDRNGFREVGRRPGYYSAPAGGKNGHALVMARGLEMSINPLAEAWAAAR
jgi:[ribosomal protein S18]-alanine N-acetyltransferase